MNKLILRLKYVNVEVINISLSAHGSLYFNLVFRKDKTTILQNISVSGSEKCIDLKISLAYNPQKGKGKEIFKKL